LLVSSLYSCRYIELISGRPILTYTGQPSMKPGVRSQDHAIIYTGHPKASNDYSRFSGGIVCDGQISGEYENAEIETFQSQDREMICKDCGGYRYTRGYKGGTGDPSPLGISFKALAALNIGSGLAMGMSFTWLNSSMNLNHPSAAMNWVRTYVTTVKLFC
jgi:hypothetical protein